ncbi:hypothetical protein [Thalassospira sp. MCCC 1A03138]|uniref:hypothetical protein n=1 Tax=Thalassospira sp. MCCC 1A03138 TaxID=1470576 RepID=UPI000A20057B|nr:hypothetical protein [Thalassospira sp. MCCC 1A03138]OSQ30687.1 hypothetical protein TH468_10770 [Thalassospira sp. MCCC 1A03138]
MSVRTIRKVYCFRHPFHLAGRVRSLPAGVYCVETYEELEAGDCFVTYIPLLTLLHLNGEPASNDARVSIQVCLEELELALMMDDIAAEELTMFDSDVSEQELRLMSDIRRANRSSPARSPFATVMR